MSLSVMNLVIWILTANRLIKQSIRTYKGRCSMENKPTTEKYKQVLSDLIIYMNDRLGVETALGQLGTSSRHSVNQSYANTYNEQAAKLNSLADKLMVECVGMFNNDDDYLYSILASIAQDYKVYVDEYGAPLPEDKQYKRQTDPYLLGLTDTPFQN